MFNIFHKILIFQRKLNDFSQLLKSLNLHAIKFNYKDIFHSWEEFSFHTESDGSFLFNLVFESNLRRQKLREIWITNEFHLIDFFLPFKSEKFESEKIFSYKVEWNWQQMVLCGENLMIKTLFYPFNVAIMIKIYLLLHFL
jgi:hypothetical protein